MGGDSAEGDKSPNNWSGGRQLDCPPKLVVFVSTVTIEEYTVVEEK